MKHTITLIALLFTIILQTSAFAESAHGYAVDFIHGEGSVSGIKLAYQYNIDQPLDVTWPMTLTMEASANFWEYGEHNQHDSNVIIAMSPIVRFPIAKAFEKDIEMELGVGISLLDDTQFAGKDISTHYQFEDRIGFSTTFGNDHEYRVSLRYLHYSNAGLKKPNPGLDFISLSFSQRI